MTTTFDLKGAREAGGKDHEILEYLSSIHDYDHEAVFEAANANQMEKKEYDKFMGEVLGYLSGLEIEDDRTKVEGGVDEVEDWEEVSRWDDLKGFINESWEAGKRLSDPTGATEGALHLTTVGLGAVAGGYTGMLAGVGMADQPEEYDIPGEPGVEGKFDLDAAYNAEMAVANLLTYMPVTEGGKTWQEAFEYPFHWWKKHAASPAGEYFDSPAVETAVEGLPIVALMGRGLVEGAVKPRVQALKGSIESNVKGMINRKAFEGIEKGVKPSVVGKKTHTAYGRYLEKAADAVESVVRNKHNLKLTDKAGNVLKNVLPQNLKQSVQAVSQTLQQIFVEYNNLMLKAGKEGVKISAQPAVDALDAIINDHVIQDAVPDVITEAIAFRERINGKVYNAQEAQQFIAALNERLKPYYEKQTIEAHPKAFVEHTVVTELRNSIDEVITKASGEEYAPLKRQYSNLKIIEKDLAHRMIVDARKNPKGFFDLADAFTGFHAVKGVITLDPVNLSASLGAHLIKSGIKWVNDPNVTMRRTFKKVEPLVNQKRLLEQKGIEPPDPFISAEGLAAEEAAFIDAFMKEYFPQYRRQIPYDPRFSPKKKATGAPLTKPEGIQAGTTGEPVTTMPAHTPQKGVSPTVEAPKSYGDIVNRAKKARIRKKPRTSTGKEAEARVNEFRKSLGLEKVDPIKMKKIRLQRTKKARDRINEFRKKKGRPPLSKKSIENILELLA